MFNAYMKALSKKHALHKQEFNPYQIRLLKAFPYIFE